MIKNLECKEGNYSLLPNQRLMSASEELMGV